MRLSYIRVCSCVQEVSNAGGGPPSEPMDEKLSQIEAAVPHLSERVNNPYDSDRQLPSPQGDRVEDIITRMTENNAEDSDSGQCTIRTTSLWFCGTLRGFINSFALPAVYWRLEAATTLLHRIPKKRAFNADVQPRSNGTLLCKMFVVEATHSCQQRRSQKCFSRSVQPPFM